MLQTTQTQKRNQISIPQHPGDTLVFTSHDFFIRATNNVNGEPWLNYSDLKRFTNNWLKELIHQSPWALQNILVYYKLALETDNKELKNFLTSYVIPVMKTQLLHQTGEDIAFTNVFRQKEHTQLH